MVSTSTFKYDPFGRRIYKSSSSGTSIFAYDGDNLIEETNSSGAAVARYAQTENIDEPLALLRSSTTSYYQVDGLGSVTSLSNGAGSLAQTYGYDSFGKQLTSTGSLTNPFQFAARESDSETGLFYNRARYYDPSAGRFLSEDPLGFLSGDVNFYAYVQNDSTSLTDPDGLSPQDCTHTCVGRARVLAGNPRKVGHQGGVPGRVVAPNSAAATPRQFGFATGAGFTNLPVSGRTGAPLEGALPGLIFPDVNSGANGPQQSFNGITDVNGGRSPIAGMNVRNALARLNPRTLILELVNGQDQGVTTVILTLPTGQPCPTGTVDSNSLKVHTNPFGL